MKKKIILFISILLFVKVEAQTSTFTLIDSLFYKGKYKEALKLLSKEPKTFTSSHKKGQIYDVLDLYKKAEKNYEEALVFKEDYNTKLKLAVIYKKQGKLVKAIKLYESVIKKDSENLLVTYKLGKLYLQTKALKKAEKTFKKLAKADVSNANYSYQLGNVYALLKKRNLKINNYLQAYKKDEKHIKAIHKLANSFTRLRDKDSANLFINKGLKINPNHYELNKLKINSLFLSKKYQKSILYLKRLDSIKTKEFYIKKMLARSYYNLKELDSAKKYFKQAYKIDRSDYKSLEYLGDIALEQKEFKEAEFRYFMSLYTAKDPRDKAYYGLARLKLEKGNKNDAIELFKEAVKENGKNYRALYQLASVSDDYYKDKKIAYKHYLKYIEKFEKKDSVLSSHVNERIKYIKKIYFLKGEILK